MSDRHDRSGGDVRRGRRAAKIRVTTTGKPPLSGAAAFARMLAERMGQQKSMERM